MLTVKNLTKYYRTALAVDDVSFSVANGEIVGLLGPNGAGKTTVLRCITGIVQITEGRIEVDGIELSTREQELKQRLAFVPEVPNPYDMLTVTEHVQFVAMAYDTLDTFKKQGDELLKRFDLYDRRNELVLNLSKGMKQKLAIVCALVHNADILLFDEPLIGIDPKGARELKNQILAAKAEGKAILISTHMLDTAQRLCDRTIILREGKIVAEGNLHELQDRARMRENATLEDVFLSLTEGRDDETADLPRT